MTRSLIFAAIFTIAGLAIGLNLQKDQTTLALSYDNSLSDNFRALKKENQHLQARLASIETQQIENQSTLQSLMSEINYLKHQAEKMPPTITLAPATLTTPTPPPPLTSTYNFNNFADKKTNALTALGINETLSQRIKERKEKQEMDRLYLRNTAIREGWFGTERYFEETRQSDQANNVYREELGDEDYDRYLFNLGENNRVRVLSVISQSPAANIGMEKGDIIIQYDHEVIFSWSDLTKATTNGDAGQEVSVVIQREGLDIELFIPRGPLGVRLENLAVNPN